MSTSIVQHPGTGLALNPEQHAWTPEQRATLAQIGVEHASEGDLAVFFHVCKRTGLDPFARQIYLIGRKERKNVDGQWIEQYKQTIQTGIDGFRLIARRAADAAGHTISVAAPEWLHHTGEWRPAWSKNWGHPIAARITIYRNGQPFTAVAMFDEYAAFKNGGGLTRMWEQRPAGQLAKCVEAAAWRMAFPQDLSGLYTSDEMAQADNGRPEAPTGPVQPQQQPARAPQQAAGDVVEGEVVPETPEATEKDWQAVLDTMYSLNSAEAVGDLWRKEGVGRAPQYLKDEFTDYANQLKAEAAKAEAA